ncbi:MAG: TolC family protein [Rhodospirillaceae bacterium]
MAACTLAPEPVNSEQVKIRIAGDLHAMFGEQVPVTAPLSLADALARALRYNLEQRVKLTELRLEENLFDLSFNELLPRVTASTGPVQRNPKNTSISADKNWDIEQTTTWNILDFGVSYFRARQAGNRILVAAEHRRKVVQSLIQDVRSAFWRAGRARQLDQDLAVLRKEHKEARAILTETHKEDLRSPIELYEIEKNLLDSLRELQLLHREVLAAPAELAGLMALPPGQNFELALPGPDEPASVLPDRATLPDRGALENLALRRRPELLEEDYQARITADETRAEISHILPGLELTASINNTYNTALTWASLAGRLTTTLGNLISLPKTLEVGEVKQEAGRVRRFALSMSILTQTDIAYQRLQTAYDELGEAVRLSEVADQLYVHTLAAHRAGLVNRLELVRRKSDNILFRTRREFAQNEVHAAVGTLLASIGIDPPLPENYSTLDLTGLAQSLAPYVYLQDFRRWPELDLTSPVKTS